VLKVKEQAPGAESSLNLGFGGIEKREELKLSALPAAHEVQKAHGENASPQVEGYKAIFLGSCRSGTFCLPQGQLMTNPSD